MTIWHPTLDGGSGPAYIRIADAIGKAIAEGSLAEGERLPPQRDLAYVLGISLNTVSRAYAEATDRGWLQGEVGRGTYVRRDGPLPKDASPASMVRPDEGPVDFAHNLPAPGQGSEALAATLDKLARRRDLASYLDYQPAGSDDDAAEAAATWLARLGLEASAPDITLTSGAQHGVLVAMLALMQPGDTLLTEAMTYAPIKIMARHLSVRLRPVAMDDGGLDPEAFDAACQATAAKVLYCLPTLHTPTTITMDAARRNEIAEVARRHDVTIIEDDVFGFLPPDRPEPLANMAPERTVFVTSTSKCLAPGLRVGYVLGPRQHCDAIRTAVSMSCWMPPPLMAAIAGAWIEDGTAENLNTFQRSEAKARQAIAREALKGHKFTADPFGFHLWLPLPEHWGAEAFRLAAARRGVNLLTAETFAVKQADAVPAVRLCLSHERSRERVRHGLSVIADLLSEPGDAGTLVV